MTNITDKHNSPIYNLSMCSLENFHTNFIKWLGMIYPKETLKLFLNNEYENISFNSQKRINSKCIFDLFITMERYGEKELLVVENKLKSFPTHKQLIEYQNCLSDEKAYFICLSLADIENMPKDWENITYSELAIKMQNIFTNEVVTDEYHKFLIKDYIAVIKNLSEKFPKGTTLKYDFYKENNLDELQDIFIKYRTSEFKDYICNNSLSPNIVSDTDFRNKQGIVNVWWKGIDTFNIPVNILIQIQKNQYRYCMTFDNTMPKDLREKIADEMFIEGYWFMHTRPTSKGKIYKEFCGYNPNFIYRYVPIDYGFGKPLEEVSYQEILEQITKDILVLENNKDKIVKLLKKFM